VRLNNYPALDSTVEVEVVYSDSTSDTEVFTATGSINKFVTTMNIGLIEQPSNTYTLDNFNPVTITFDTAPPPDHIVYIRNQRGAEDEFDFFVASGVEVTFITQLDLSIPVRVYVGGIELPTEIGYQVTSLDPVIILFNEAPPTGVEVTVLVREGVTWYQQGIDTASNGVPLQITETFAARFLRGV
jgi:hypothetical protein